MKRFIYTLAFVLVLHCTLKIDNCQSQWVQMVNSGSPSSLEANENYIFAGFGGNGIYLSTDSCTTWTYIGLTGYVCGIAINGNYIYASIRNSGVYLSTNNGTNWSQTSLNFVDALSIAVSGENVFAGTAGGGVYVSTNNGTNWSQTSLNNQDVTALNVNGSIIYAGCFSGVFRSTNYGVNWSQTSLNNKSILSIASLGNDVYAGAQGGIFISTNNGTNWNQSYFLSLWFTAIKVDEFNIFAGTNNGFWLGNRNGTSWTRRMDGFNVDPLVISEILVANNFVYAGTELYKIYRRPLSELSGIQTISTEIPFAYSLFQNYPNPFNPTTKIKFDVVRLGEVKIVVYDAMGREVQTLVNERLQPGTYEAFFDGSTLNSGVYFYKLTAGNFVETKKMLMIK